jgi:hypothetical protein
MDRLEKLFDYTLRYALEPGLNWEYLEVFSYQRFCYSFLKTMSLVETREGDGDQVKECGSCR